MAKVGNAGARDEADVACSNHGNLHLRCSKKAPARTVNWVLLAPPLSKSRPQGQSGSQEKVKYPLSASAQLAPTYASITPGFPSGAGGSCFTWPGTRAPGGPKGLPRVCQGADKGLPRGWGRAALRRCNYAILCLAQNSVSPATSLAQINDGSLIRSAACHRR